MTNFISNGDLLDDLQRLTACEYLSDLKDPANWAKIASELSRLEIVRYFLTQWGIALTYITDSELRFAAFEDVAAYFVKAAGSEVIK